MDLTAITLTELRYVVAVADTEHLGRAAALAGPLRLDVALIPLPASGAGLVAELPFDEPFRVLAPARPVPAQAAEAAS